VNTRFITDMGPGPLVFTDEITGETTTLGRYGVWASRAPFRKAEVVEVGEDLSDLQARYGPDLPVIHISRAQSNPSAP
jgi:hypothetical protein